MKVYLLWHAWDKWEPLELSGVFLSPEKARDWHADLLDGHTLREVIYKQGSTKGRLGNTKYYEIEEWEAE